MTQNGHGDEGMSESRSRELAAEVAGSCRLSGIKVSREQEEQMARIIRGEVDARVLIEEIKAEIIARYRKG